MDKAGKKWVLLTDVVGSRKIKDRATFEKIFAQAIATANREFEYDLILPMKGWKGLDEQAAMIGDPKCLYRLADLLNNLLAPVQLRLSIVKHEVDVLPADKDIRSADGPAFHEAAAQMLQLKKEGLLFGILSGDRETDEPLAVSINLLLLQKEAWTRKQRAIYTAYCQTGNQEAVAKKLSVSQQAVSKALKTIKGSQVQLLENGLQQWLDKQYR
jgi:hypothetical protein